jgi:hypothetical protein
MINKCILGLGLCLSVPTISSLLLITEAQAQENPVFANQVEELLPGSIPIADGKNIVEYHFLFIDKNGEAITGLKGKTTIGKSKGSLLEHGNGLYSTKISPEKRTEAGSEELVVKAKNTKKQSVNKTFSVLLEATSERTFKITSNPSEITLTQDEFVTLNITQTSGTPTNKLLIASSAGTINDVVTLGDGNYSVRYTPPTKELYPHIALFTLADANDPSNVETFVLKQNGKTNLPINTKPNSNVIIKIEDKDFGPVQTDDRGKASVPIIVPPGVSKVKLITITDGKRTEEPLDLKIPNNVQRINFFPITGSLVADGKTSTTLYLYASTADGKPDISANIIFKSNNGTFGNLQTISDGLYSVTYTANSSNSKDSDTIQAILQSETGDNIDMFDVSLIPEIPENVTVKSEVDSLQKNAKSFNLVTTLKNAENKGMTNRGISFAANGAKIIQTKELGNGDYITKFEPTSNGPVEVTAVIKGSTSNNPAHGIMMFGSQNRLPNDGLSSSTLTFMVYDQFGYPLSDQKLSLELTSGNGSIPSQVTTNSAGVGQVTYTAGNTAGVTQIQVTSESLTNTFAVLQVPENILNDLNELPRSGVQSDNALEQSLASFINTIRIEREGMEGAQISANFDKIGDTNSLNVTAEPTKVIPGGKVILKISAVDANGRGVAGENLDAFASGGTISRIQDIGGGQYNVSYTAADDATEAIKITIATSDEKISTDFQLQVVLSDEIPVTPVVTDDSPSKEELAAAKTAEKEAKRAEKEAEKEAKRAEKEASRESNKSPNSNQAKAPMLRARVGFSAGSYGYQQEPTSTDGALYGKRITFNNQTENSEAAQSVGFDISLNGTLPSLEYVGYDVKLHSDTYSVILPEFEDPIRDWITSFDAVIIGQYPISLGDITITPGMRAGILRDDLLIFRQNDLGGSEIELVFEPLPVNAFSLGGSLGLETTYSLFGNFFYDAGIRGTVYRQKSELQMGYTLPSNVFLYGAGRSTSRNIDIDGSSGKVGEIHDLNRSFIFGFGYGM